MTDEQEVPVEIILQAAKNTIDLQTAMLNTLSSVAATWIQGLQPLDERMSIEALKDELQVRTFAKVREP